MKYTLEEIKKFGKLHPDLLVALKLPRQVRIVASALVCLRLGETTGDHAVMVDSLHTRTEGYLIYGSKSVKVFAKIPVEVAVDYLFKLGYQFRIENVNPDSKSIEIWRPQKL